MEIELLVDTAQSPTAVTILRPQGRVDGSTYESLIARAKGLIAGGAQRLLLDLGAVSFLSSAGLVALHSIALMVRGENLPGEQSGWDALYAIGRDSSGKQTNLKLLNPPEKVLQTLDRAGMTGFFDIFTDEATALASFA
jgi:anti-anti-sigma regulatory factor